MATLPQTFDPLAWAPPEWGAPPQPDPLALALPLPQDPVAPTPPVGEQGAEPVGLAPVAPAEPYFDEEGFQQAMASSPPGEMSFPPDDFRDLAPAAEMNFAPDDFSSPMPNGIAPPPWDDAPAEETFAPDDLADDPLAREEEARQASLAPEAFAAESAQRETNRATLLATRQTEELRRNEQEAIDNHHDLQTANAAAMTESAAIRTDASKLASQGIDNDHWWESRSTGQKAAAYLTAMVGGFLAPTNGGRNSGLDLILGAIDRDIETQAANLSHQRDMLGVRQGAVSALFAENGDAFRSKETVRLAAFQHLDTKLAAEAARFDPRGTAAQRIAEARMGVRQKQAAAAAALDETTFERNLKEKREVEKHRKEMRPKGPAKLSLGDQLKMREMGVTRDAKGNLVDDPRGPVAKPLSPSDQRAENALIVKDSITGKELSKADSDRAATGAMEAQKAWHSAEQNLARMRVLRKEIGTTVGTRLLRGADNDARVAEYDALADQTATLLVKADDPTSTVRDNEKESVIKARLPMYDTPLSEGPEAAEARDKAALSSVRGAVKRAMAAANVKDFDPGSYYDDAPKPEETLTDTAARAASAVKTTPSRELRGPDSFDPATKTTIPGKRISEVPLFDSETQRASAIGTLESKAISGDEKAVKYLQAIAADSGHPGSAMAEAALARVEGR